MKLSCCQAAGFCRQPLENQQIEFRRLADQAGQQGMDLAAVVGLVIEPVRQRRGQLLLELLGRGDAAVFDRSRDAPVIEPVHKIDDPPVLPASRAARSSANVSNRIASSRFGASPSPVNRCIQTRSVASRWFKLPWTDLKKAPRSARYCSVLSGATAS
jgi:hypothetical protein